MKIINIIQRYPPAVGGSETWCQEVSRYLAEQGHNVKVLTLNIDKEEEYWRVQTQRTRTRSFGKMDYDKGVLVRRYKRSLPIHYFHHLFLGKILDKMLKIHFYGPHSSEMYGKMWREIRNSDIVFLHTIPYPHNFIALLIAKILGKKTVITPHFHPGHPHYERRINYWLLRKCDAVIAVSPFEKKYLIKKGIDNQKIYVTGNAIHPERYIPQQIEDYKKRLINEYGVKSDDKILIFIGRKIPDKGIKYLIDSVKILNEKMPIKLFLVGPASDWYYELINSLSPYEKKIIIDLGTISQQEKVNLLHLSDLFVLPSKYEAFGIVFLESWICGTPVLGSDQGAIPSIIEEEGYICKFGDTNDLVDKIEMALSDSEGLKQKGLEGKNKTLKKYTWDIIGAETEKAVKNTYGKEKIIICCNAYPPAFIGGAEFIAHNQAKVLSKQGYDVLVFAGMPDASKKQYSVSKDTYEGIKVVRVCLHPKDYSSDFFSFTHKEVDNIFESLLEKFSPDIVHFHNINGLSVGIIEIAAKKKIKTVMTLHDYWGICHKNTLIKKEGVICEKPGVCEECQAFISDNQWQKVPSILRRDFITLQLSLVDEFISPSFYLANRYEKELSLGKSIRVIPNGIDISKFKELTKCTSSKVRFTYIGTLGRHKGIHIIIEALELLKDINKIHFHFVGVGEQKKWLEKTVAERNLSEHVSIWGKVENANIGKVLEKTDVLVLPSIWPENQPVTITEAMAAQKPVIASNIGGIPELVDHGKTGYLFEPGNPKALVSQMNKFISNPSLIEKFGEKGFSKISNFTFENQVKYIKDIYNKNFKKYNKTIRRPIVMCKGYKFDDKCIKAICSVNCIEEKPFFVMQEWVSDYFNKLSEILWVIDASIDNYKIVEMLSNNNALLVPEKNSYVKSICLKNNLGLYYLNEEEASECLHFLIKNIDIRKALAKNGLKYFLERNF